MKFRYSIRPKGQGHKVLASVGAVEQEYRDLIDVLFEIIKVEAHTKLEPGSYEIDIVFDDWASYTRRVDVEQTRSQVWAQEQLCGILDGG